MKSIYFFLLFIIVMAVLLTITGFIWMVVLLLPFFLIWLLVYTSRNESIRKKIHYRLILFPVAIIIAVFLRLLVITFFFIPTKSMENSLLSGEYVLVSKLQYGPLMPTSPFEIPWVNVLSNLSSKAKEKVNDDWWKTKRLRGFVGVTRGDIVVFKYPLNKFKVYVKRCVAVAGDTLLIKDGKLVVNNSSTKEPQTIVNSFKVWYNDWTSFHQLLDSLGLDNEKNSSENEYQCSEVQVSQLELKGLISNESVDSVRQNILPPDRCFGVFPDENSFKWSVDDFGPLIIPKKGMKIELTHDNILRYGRILKKFEKLNIERFKDLYLVEGNEIGEYKFSKDYYFMLGDNRHHSNDSRYWGFVPDDYLIGKAMMVVWSESCEDEEGKIRWGRIGKIVL
ncbi:MAG: signal peptidase I [Marinifilaceae bacterium]